MSFAPGRRWLYAPVLALYLLAFPYHPGLRSPNELVRLWQTRALVEHGELELNAALRDYGYVGDMSKKDGRYYPSKAPLLSFAAVPLYKVLSWAGGGGRHAVPELPLLYWSRLLLTVLPTLLLLVLLRRFLAHSLPLHLADGLTLTYALGSLALSYSLLFMSHQPTAALVFGAFYLLWKNLRADAQAVKPLRYVGAGALVGAAVAAEYTGALAVAGVVLYGVVTLWRKQGLAPREKLVECGRALGWATLGALPFVLGLMAYHHAVFGHPLHSGYKYLNDAAYQDWHVGGFLGIRFPDPEAFVLSFFSPLRGLFALSPFLLLALPGVALLWRRDRSLFALCAALLLGYAYFTSSFAYDSWGWTTGPRHLTPLVPFLLLPAGLTLHWLQERGRYALAGVGAGLAAASVLVTGLASLVNYIPDSVSNPVFGLALPLFKEGFLPPTFPGLLTGAHVLFGWVMVVLVVLGAAVVAHALVPRVLTGPLETRERARVRVRVPFSASLTAVASCALVLGLLAFSTRHDERDEGAQRHLRGVWLTAPGKDVTFWPPGR